MSKVPRFDRGEATIRSDRYLFGWPRKCSSGLNAVAYLIQEIETSHRKDAKNRTARKQSLDSAKSGCGSPILRRAEQIDCFEHVRAGDEMAESARKRLVEPNLLVVSIAERYRNHPVDLLDLIEKGMRACLDLSPFLIQPVQKLNR